MAIVKQFVTKVTMLVQSPLATSRMDCIFEVSARSAQAVQSTGLKVLAYSGDFSGFEALDVETESPVESKAGSNAEGEAHAQE